ncbi:hypothetical protein IEQ34_017009 [Dendrobium chrysotoxum]|uniref:Uncharacterized protein n=1 Tax=Dendrobium chrysotoxum TaxID=161865 RepID=A0AAV7FZ84_DENCH|nr:hypothetical protein IEQ34_017009 [Dendrobium chrysotoxum]
MERWWREWMAGLGKDWRGVRVLGNGERKRDDVEVSMSLFLVAKRLNAAVPTTAAEEEAIGRESVRGCKVDLCRPSRNEIRD